jgi:hypothetical protein
VPVAPLILTNVILSGDDCHCTLPTELVKVIFTFAPEQTVEAEALAVPLAVVGLTVRVVELLTVMALKHPNASLFPERNRVMVIVYVPAVLKAGVEKESDPPDAV